MRLSSLLAAAAAFVFAAGPAGAQTQTTFADDLDGPFRVIQLTDGRVLVSEGRLSSGQGDQVTAFAGAGAAGTVFVGDLSDPTGILQLADGRVLVTTRGTDFAGYLARFTSTGGSAEGLASGLGVPRDLIRVGDRLLIVDGSTDGRVVSLSLDGTDSRTLITGLSGPQGIVQLSDGRLLVTEGAGGRVLAYNADGTGQTSFATGLVGPGDIIQTTDGRVLVTDDDAAAASTDGRVLAFSADGTPRGALVGGLARPFGLTQLSSGPGAGNVLVTVFGNDARDAGSIIEVTLTTSSDADAPALATVGVPSPNPAVGAATLDVEVETSQRVRVAVYDALGREVAVAFDGAVAAGRTVPVALDAGRLAPGAYVVRVGGETFTEARRLMVVR